MSEDDTLQATSLPASDDDLDMIASPAESRSGPVLPEEFRIALRPPSFVLSRENLQFRVALPDETYDNQNRPQTTIRIKVYQTQDTPQALYVQIVNCPHINPEHVMTTLEKMLEKIPQIHSSSFEDIAPAPRSPEGSSSSNLSTIPEETSDFAESSSSSTTASTIESSPCTSHRLTTFDERMDVRVSLLELVINLSGIGDIIHTSLDVYEQNALWFNTLLLPCCLYALFKKKSWQDI